MKTLEVVLKITERCNIDCTYCYVFNQEDQSYKQHPPIIKMDTVQKLATFLKDGIKQQGIEKIQIIFHGGEPCLLGVNRLEKICNIFICELKTDDCQLGFALQTNATLINEKWITLFSKYQIQIGVSLDGPKHLNDLERIDFSGKGTYDKTINGLMKLQKAHNKGQIPHVGILSVSNPNTSSEIIFDHFVNELGMHNFDVLMPIDSHDYFNQEKINEYKKYYKQLFDRWVTTADKKIDIRIISNILSSILNGKEYIKESLHARSEQNLIITVSSNGEVGPDDSLRSLGGGLFTEINVFEHSYSDLIDSKMFQLILNAENTIPDECSECPWKQLCRGGAIHGRLVNRFKQGTGFNNKSIMCDVLDDLYSEMSAFLLKNSINYEQLQASLFTSHSHWRKYTKEQVMRENLLVSQIEHVIEVVNI